MATDQTALPKTKTDEKHSLLEPPLTAETPHTLKQYQ